MLRVVLETLNREIETANRRDDAIWFPMGCCHERILRLTAKEAVLLNSREKVGTVSHDCCVMAARVAVHLAPSNSTVTQVMVSVSL